MIDAEYARVREMQIMVRMPTTDGAWMDQAVVVRLLPSAIAPQGGVRTYVGELRDQVGWLYDVVLTLAPVTEDMRERR